MVNPSTLTAENLRRESFRAATPDAGPTHSRLASHVVAETSFAALPENLVCNTTLGSYKACVGSLGVNGLGEDLVHAEMDTMRFQGNLLSSLNRPKRK